MERDKLREIWNEYQFTVGSVLLALGSRTFVRGNKLVFNVRVNRLVDLIPTEIASVGGNSNHRLNIGGLHNDSFTLD